MVCPCSTGQLASGFILIYLRSLRPGDYVRVADCEGTVKDIGLFTMTLTTPFNEVVSLPNVVVLGSQVTNYSRPAAGSTAQLQAPVTIGYDTSWRQVHEVLHAAVQGVTGVIHAPPPVVLQRALSDFYVEYTLCVHIAEPSARVQVLSALNAAILDRFHAAGIQVMSPHYLGDPAKPKVAAVPDRTPDDGLACPDPRYPLGMRLLAAVCIAASLSAADLPPGRYRALFTLDGHTETQPAALIRNGDLVSVAPDNGEPMMQGKIVPGAVTPRLLLARHRFIAEGIQVDVIVVDITEDGYATGYAHRSLNGEPRERIAIILRKE